jgi:uncharacterized membrane protein required for colicin V production
MADLIFLIILSIALVIGYKIGFLKAIISFVGIIISAIGGYLLYPFITPIIMKTPLYGLVNNIVIEFLKIQYKTNIDNQNIPQLFVKYGANTIDGLIKNMSTGITVVILNILSLIIIIIGIKILISVLKGMSGFVNKIPIVGTFNRILGMLVSGVSCIILIYVFVAVMLLPPSNNTELSKKMCLEINKSVIVSRVMDYNIFVSYNSLSKN